jgi:hypothetical protein
MTLKLQTRPTFVRRFGASVGWALAGIGAILGGLVKLITNRSEAETMHEPTTALLFLVILMFPCLMSMVHPD